MSYTRQRKLIDGFFTGAPLKEFERNVLLAPPAQQCAVDALIAHLLGQATESRFHGRLRGETKRARESAQKALSCYPVTPKRVGTWLRDTLHCTDCILRVYHREVLGGNGCRNSDPLPREALYQTYQSHTDPELGQVGAHHVELYRRHLEIRFGYYSKLEFSTSELRRISGGRLKWHYNACCELLRKSMAIMTARFE